MREVFFYSSKCRLPVLLPQKFVHNKSLSGLSFSLTLSKKTEIKGRGGRGGSNLVQNYTEYCSLPTPELFHSPNFVPTQFQEVETERDITFHLKVNSSSVHNGFMCDGEERGNGRTGY